MTDAPMDMSEVVKLLRGGGVADDSYLRKAPQGRWEQAARAVEIADEQVREMVPLERAVDGMREAAMDPYGVVLRHGNDEQSCRAALADYLRGDE